MKHIVNPQIISVLLNSDKKGKGIFTAKSLRTGKDFTYMIKRKIADNGNAYNLVYIETNYMEFRYLGIYYNGGIFNKKKLVDSPSAQGLSWILNKVVSGDYDKLIENVEIMHLGSCIKCGKTLTDAESISVGLGPVCRS